MGAELVDIEGRIIAYGTDCIIFTVDDITEVMLPRDKIGWKYIGGGLSLVSMPQWLAQERGIDGG